ncbi:MAG: YdiU family protein [Pseudomonadota bacterium]
MSSASFRPSSAYFDLAAPDGAAFWDAVEPAKFPEHVLRYRNDRAAAPVGLDGLSDDEWIAHFGRFEPLPGAQKTPVALRYHGHQFRHYNPDIGDGRGFLFAQAHDGAGRLLDFGTKGSGRTPYSRSGDGRLTLKGAVREILATEMLGALGVYTSKTLSVVETGEALERHDEPSPTRSAVLVRLGHSHIRFGVFQRLAFFEETQAIERLVGYCIDNLHPDLKGAADPAVALFERVVAVSARLAAQWMAAGFVHGVLNTDNQNVTGESFDYGPWRFLPVLDPEFTAAYFDQTGLYAYGRQPESVAWALAQFGGALTKVAEQETLNAALGRFGELYAEAAAAAFHKRLGLRRLGDDSDLQFVTDLFAWMRSSGVPFEQVFFDWFCGEASAARAAESPFRSRYDLPEWAPVEAGLRARAPERPERLDHAYFKRERPRTMLIDEVEAIWAPIAEADDWSVFEAALAEIALLREAHAVDPLSGFGPPGIR